MPAILACSTAAAAQLTFQQNGGRVTIRYGGSLGISSWRVVINRDNGANIEEVHAPADGPNLCSGDGKGPTLVPIVGPGHRGWDFFKKFTPAIFKVEEQSPARVVISMGGISPRKMFEHYRTYTFTREGFKIKGKWIPLVQCRHVSNWGGWDYRHVETPGEKLPMRSQGTTEWKYMSSGATDGSPKSLPAGVRYPLVTRIKIRGHENLYMYHFFDQKLESMRDRLLYQVIPSLNKLNDIMGSWRGVSPREEQTYQIRVHFVDESGGGETTKLLQAMERAGPFVRLASVVRRIETGQGLGRILTRLARSKASRDAETAREAEALFRVLDAYAQASLRRASTKSSNDPATSITQLEALARQFQGHAIGARAAEASHKLRNDPKIRTELVAESLYRRIVQLKDRLRPYKKRRDPKDPTFRRKNRVAIDNIVRNCQVLASRYSGTSAAEKAQALAKQFQ